jgi:NADH:ubiquinone oxidoreductase subunit 2 (subunit N)
MLDSYIAYIINASYILGGIGLLVSVIAYLYLPKALRMVFEDESDDSEDNTDA